jgi:hypothetical protein
MSPTSGRIAWRRPRVDAPQDFLEVGLSLQDQQILGLPHL